MTEYCEFLSIPPYSLAKIEKKHLLTSRFQELTNKHYTNCESYRNMLDVMGIRPESVNAPEDTPYLPVSLFKKLDLFSVDKSEIIKTITSSGTTGQAVSKIFLDRNTASNQQKTLVKIVSDFIGPSRLPMIIIDCPSVVKNRLMFSARGAGILGFSIFGADKIYALDDDMKINENAIFAFLEKHQGQRILLFGFTFMIWQHFFKELKQSGRKIDLSNGFLIHGGGWKKLISEAVSHDAFHACLNDVCGLKQIHDYYGMAEQTGCIYMECECGYLHASVFSDIIMRRHIDFSPCAQGENGIIQVLSTLPESYPGHSILTEDCGVILGEDDCPCGRKGKYFSITGRIQNAEIRGCSDTYAAEH
jgi:phenylacetate-coenzyme A ligase PaaK-like adenylate-forming protein